MAVIVEGSPANASPIQRGADVVQIVDWWSPAHNLSTCQWRDLNLLWLLSAKSLFAPDTFSLASLAIALVNGSINLLISHGLIVNINGFLFVLLLIPFEVVDVGVCFSHFVFVVQDLRRSFQLSLSLLRLDLLFPAFDLKGVVEKHRFLRNFPGHYFVLIFIII